MKASAIDLEEFVNSGKLADSIPRTEASTLALSSEASTRAFVAEKPSSFKGEEPAQFSASEQKPSSTITHLKGLDIKDPVELLIMLDEDLGSGRKKLYPWQLQILTDFATGGQSAEHALQQIVRACNGSGKDVYVIAPCAVWLCMANIKARCVVTSASGQQLDAQTGTYITDLCQAANRKFQELFGCDIWKINYRYYECLATGSIIDMFATDEPKKAEGYHPRVADAKMGIFVSEDKTIPDEINEALSRCSGYTHRLHVSTPGEPQGHFFDYCSIATDRKLLKSVLDAGPIDWIQYHVTAFDCGHLGTNHALKVERDSPGGKDGVYYRSVILAEFGSTESMVVIPSFYVWKACLGCKNGWLHKPYNDAGLDLSDGGDETVLAIRNGNKLLHLLPFRFDNTEDTVKYLDGKFREFQLNNARSRINADCVGIGKPILDRLKRMGWNNIFYIDARNKPSEPRVYKNRNAELWFRFRRLCENNELWLLDDLKLKKQLSSRFYKLSNGIHQLESKIDARAKGHVSPDRADAVVLAYWDYEGVFVAPTVERPFELDEVVPSVTVKKAFTLREYAHTNGESKEEQLYPGRRKDFSFVKDLLNEHNTRVRSIESN